MLLLVEVTKGLLDVQSHCGYTGTADCSFLLIINIDSFAEVEKAATAPRLLDILLLGTTKSLKQIIMENSRIFRRCLCGRMKMLSNTQAIGFILASTISQVLRLLEASLLFSVSCF
jgi:hypothetical protein